MNSEKNYFRPLNFNFLSRLTHLQDLVSYFISSYSSVILHNVEKYIALKKVHYLTGLEQLEGSYLEFGVFSGSSICHSVRCCQKLVSLHPSILSDGFYGFDSFSGFGELSEADRHPFYQDLNFEVSFGRVHKRLQNLCGKKVPFNLVPGYFDESLKRGPRELGIQKARVIFIDSDTYSSAHSALEFCKSILQPGTYILLDDFYSYKGSKKKGVAGAFFEFIKQHQVNARFVFSYGMGGVVYVISE